MDTNGHLAEKKGCRCNKRTCDLGNVKEERDSHNCLEIIQTLCVVHFLFYWVAGTTFFAHVHDLTEEVQVPGSHSHSIWAHQIVKSLLQQRQKLFLWPIWHLKDTSDFYSYFHSTSLGDKICYNLYSRQCCLWKRIFTYLFQNNNLL